MATVRRKSYFHPERVIGRLGNQLLRYFGYEVNRFSEGMSLDAALTRLQAKQIQIKTVVDVGASDGRWTKSVRPFYPDAHYLLIDANGIHEPALSRLVENDPAIEYVIAAAGAHQGEIDFDARDQFGGVALDDATDYSVKLPVITVDQAVAEKGLSGPFLLKLDTHGFEVPIFEGAKAILAQTDIIVVETYNFEITDSSLRFAEMVAYLDTCGFRPIDMCEPLFRPQDKSLWQFDLIFIPKTRVEFQHKVYNW